MGEVVAFPGGRSPGGSGGDGTGGRMLEQRVARLEEDIRDVKATLKSMDTRLGSIELALAKIDGHIAGMEGRLSGIEGRLQMIPTVWQTVSILAVLLFGVTGIVFAALASGAIDVYPEYTGTLDREILKNRAPSDIAALNRQLAGLGIGVAVPLGFNNTYALAMREEQARALGIRTLSDLARQPSLRLGLSQEFLGRADGWRGLKQAYALPFATPRGIDHGLAYEAVAQGQVDVIDIYTTDAKIARYKLRVLIDDRRFFPAYDAVLLYRLDLPRRAPATWAALQGLAGKITARRMIDLNAGA